MVIFSSTVLCGKRLNDWKTMPICWRILSRSAFGRGDIDIIEQNAACLDLLQPIDATQQGRFAAAGASDQADDLMGVDGQIDVLQHQMLVVGLVDMLDTEQWRRAQYAPPDERRRASRCTR